MKIVSAQRGQAKSAFTMDVYGHFMPGAEGAGPAAIEAVFGAGLGASGPTG